MADTGRVELLNDLAFAFRNTEVTQAASYARQARELAEQIGYAKGLARAIGYQGMMSYRQGRYDFAIMYHLQSLKIADSIGATQQIAFRYNDLANVYLDKEDLEKALFYNLRSLSIKQQINDQEGIATSYRNMGLIHLRQYNYDSAQLYLDLAEKLASEIGDQRILGYVYMYMGQLQTKKGDAPGAIRTLIQSRKLHLEINNLYGLAEAMNSLAEAYLAANMLSEALTTFEQALSISQRTNTHLESRRAYLGLATAYEKKQQFAEALRYQKRYMQLKDSIFAEKHEQTIAYLDAQFQSGLKQTQINLLTKEKETAAKKAQTERRYNTALLAVAFLIAISLAIITRIMLEKRKLNNDLMKKQTEIEVQSQELQKLNAFKDRLFFMIAHDLRSPMASLKSTIEILDPKLLSAEELNTIKNELHRQFGATDETLQNLLTWARSQMEGESTSPIGIGLHSAVDEIAGFLSNLSAAKQINLQNHINPEWKVWVDPDHLSAILRNLIANAIKFTRYEGEIIIEAVIRGQMIEVAVIDNGIGMSEEQMHKILAGERFSLRGTAGEKGSGFGVLMVKDLVEKNGGTMRIESVENKGSTFYFTLPLWTNV